MFQDYTTPSRQSAMTYNNTHMKQHRSPASIHGVTEEVLIERDETLEPLLVRYKDWITTNGIEDLRSDDEYTRDALTLGILWRCYGQRVLGMPAFNAFVYSGFRHLRQKFTSDHSADAGSGGKLARQLLHLKSRKNKRSGLTSPCETMALLFWLKAINVYDDDVKRMTPLCTFLNKIDPLESEWHLARLSAFTARVLMICEKKLPMDELASAAGEIEREKRRTSWLSALAGSPEEQYLRVLELELRRRAKEEKGEAKDEHIGGYSFEIAPA